MTYGHSDRASAASDAAVKRALARAAGTWGGYRAWRQPKTPVRDAAERMTEPAPKLAPEPANDVTLAEPDCEQRDYEKGCIGNGFSF